MGGGQGFFHYYTVVTIHVVLIKDILHSLKVRNYFETKKIRTTYLWFFYFILFYYVVDQFHIPTPITQREGEP